jgi:hypothetical protein
MTFRIIEGLKTKERWLVWSYIVRPVDSDASREFDVKRLYV